MIFYGNIQIPRISGNFDACADSAYQALFPRKKGSLGSRLVYKLATLLHCTTSYIDILLSMLLHGCGYYVNQLWLQLECAELVNAKTNLKISQTLPESLLNV